MNSSISGLLSSSMMKDGTDFSDQSSVIFELWNKYQKSNRDMHQVNELCELLIEIKQSINSNTTVKDLEQICKRHQSQKWVGEFIGNLSKCTVSSATTELDPEKANASLHVPAYGNQIRRTREKLDQCATVCSPLIDLPTLNTEQLRKLQRVQELLRDIKDTIEFIIDDLQNKIIQATKYRSNNYFSALMNFLSTIMNAMLWDRISRASGENSRSSLTTAASTAIQATCTIGDLIHAGKANDLIVTLQEILNAMTDLDEKQQRLAIQVTNRLANMDDPLLHF